MQLESISNSSNKEFIAKYVTLRNIGFFNFVVVWSIFITVLVNTDINKNEFENT